MRWLFGRRYISSLHSADVLQQERNSCPLLRSCCIGSCHVGVSKRFSRSISLAVFCFFSAILEKKTIKTSEVIFHIRFRTLWLSSSLFMGSCMLVFLSVIKNIVVLCPSLFVFFRPRDRSFTHNSKELSSRETFS